MSVSMRQIIISFNHFQDDSFLHKHTTALALSLLTVLAVYSRDVGYVIFVLVILGFLVAWFFLEHFAIHTEKWWQRSAFMEKYLNSMLMNDTTIVEKPLHLPTLMKKLTRFSVDFIKEAKDHELPFALFHSFSAVHTPLTPGKAFRGKSKYGAYGDRYVNERIYFEYTKYFVQCFSLVF